MPWTSIIVWLISFLAAKAKGVSTGKAALLATGLAAATYYLADPANPDNLLGVSFGSAKATPGDTTQDNGLGSKVTGLASTAISQVGETARSWGPKGVLTAVAGGKVLASDSASDFISKYGIWLLIGGAFLLLRR